MTTLTRRDFLDRCCSGMGAVALSSLLAEAVSAQDRTISPIDPLAPRRPAFAPRAKRVIFLFQYGGPSQVDTWDFKPDLLQLHGQPVPASFKETKDKVGGVFKACHDKLMHGPWGWKRYGQSGIHGSDLVQHTAQHVDKMCFIRSMVSESSNHAPATYQMNTGAILPGRPSLGSWLTYGLGSENRNLPGYVLLFKVAGLGGAPNWSNGFLPAAFQGTPFRHDGDPVLDLRPPPRFVDSQRATLDAILQMNQTHQGERPGLLDLDGRIASYELAYRMQSEALEVGDLSGESRETLGEYRVHSQNPSEALYGRMCLLSRRLCEKGVRIVQLYNAVDKFGWDGHDNNTRNHQANADQTDRPTAALLADLQRRGLLDETLVVWAGEFGRTPMEQGNGGRNHNPYGFTIWMAGGGVKGGQVIGATDGIGLRADVDPHPVKDLHATILTALGLRPDDLFFENNGRPERLTGVAGSSRIIPGVLR
ncbi:MAG TPA: DUF1501 domain-containing protein [Planctomycetota bacterium]|nr:DUF1501 domain-containing protein [Planctomycetota bacterium]